VARDLVDIPEVLECHLISGEFDYLVKARLKEMSAYRRLLGDLLKTPCFSFITQLCGDGGSQGVLVFGYGDIEIISSRSVCRNTPH
jgi:DNA-binding Lrp family transcriptional regulator